MLLVIAYALYAQALAQLAQQVQKITQIQQEAKQTIDKLGQTWIGIDYDACKAKFQGGLFPGLSSLINTAQDFISRLNKALDRMKQAEQQATQAVQSLVDVFNAI